jgi:hypothetical protein
MNSLEGLPQPKLLDVSVVGIWKTATTKKSINATTHIPIRRIDLKE